jgi:hypothetical protein
MKTSLIRQLLLFLLVLSLLVLNFMCGGGPPDERTSPTFRKRSCDTLLKYGDKNLNAVMFMTPFYGIAVGDSGTVIITKNGGNTWLTPIISATPKNLYGVAVNDASK